MDKLQISKQEPYDFYSYSRGIRLKLFMDILFFIVIAYLGYKFIQVLIKMKQKVILPTTNEECAAIRKIPGKAVDLPTYSKQKIGIIIYSFKIGRASCRERV